MALRSYLKLEQHGRRMAKVGLEAGILVLAVLFALYTFPTNYMTATAVVAVVVFVLNKSVMAVLGVFIGAAVLRLFIDVNPKRPAPKLPMPNESFAPAPKDPISIHQRITSQKTGAPLAPLSTVTGVLESPHILNSLQVSEVVPGEMGATMKTLPASVKLPEIIATPPELSPQSSESQVPFKANPMLQNGEDTDSILTALVSKGTSLFAGQPSSELASAKMSA